MAPFSPPALAPFLLLIAKCFYFFCKSGEELLRIAYGMDSDFDAFLRDNEREAIRALLGAVNAAFGVCEPAIC